MIQTSPSGLGTLGHPGIFIGQTQGLGLRNHIDIPYITALAPEKPLDFGVLDLWALKQRTDSPMLTMAVDNASIIYTDADSYTYDLPATADPTNRLVSGGTGAPKQGRDGEEIPFVVTKRDLAPGSIFKFDLTSRISFMVVDRPVEQVGEHFKLWARLNTNAQVPYVSQAEFQSNRQIIKLADTRGLDFSSHKSVWSISGGGMSKYKNYISNAILQQSYRVTSGGVEYLQRNTRFGPAEMREMEQTILQFYQVRGIADAKVTDFTKDRNAYKDYAQRLAEEKAKGNGHAAMVNLLDALSISFILEQNNNLMIWSDAINELRDGYDTTRLVPGVWFQLDQAGYKHTYSIDLFSMDMVANAIKDFEFGKVAPKPYVSEAEYVIKTGRAGQQLWHKEFIKHFGTGVPAQIMNSDHGFVTGPADKLEVHMAQVTRYQYPGLGWLRVEWEPGFDPTMADEFVNPILPGGYRLSSYTMLIEDYNMSKDNIVILRKTGNNLRMIIRNGDQSHPLLMSNTNINGQNIQYHQASDELTGYETKFIGKVDTAIVKDPTRLLKLVPKNPKTGLASL